MTERTCTQCGNGDLYPRRCSQCGQRWADRACGPTHALIAEELGIGDLRRELAGFGPATLCECGHPVVHHDRSQAFCEAALPDLSGPCPCMSFAVAQEAGR